MAQEDIWSDQLATRSLIAARINNFLIKGLAPESSYGKDRKDEIDILLIKNDKRYQEFYQHINVKNMTKIHQQEYGFDIIYLNDIDKNYIDRDVVDDLVKSYKSPDFVVEDISTLAEIITNPWENTFGMGYRILPITKMLIGKIEDGRHFDKLQVALQP